MTELVKELPKQELALTNDISDLDIICVTVNGGEKGILQKSAKGFYCALLVDSELPWGFKKIFDTKEEAVNYFIGCNKTNKAYRFETLKEALEFMLS